MTYTTTQGDAWDGISFKLFGTERHVPELILVNIEHRNTVIFGGGEVLNVPIIPDAEAVELPPWKRGMA